MDDESRHLLRQQSRRALVLLLLIIVVAFVVASRAAHEHIVQLTTIAAAYVDAHSVTGVVVFFVLSLLSAMFAFLSTAALVPVAVTAWGKAATLFILWLGWLAGGVCSYLVGRYLGRTIVARIMSERRLRIYEEELRHIGGFPLILLFQLALPSEVPGYVLGTLRYDARIYFAALALAELPFAFGAVYLGDSFTRGDFVLLISLGIAGIALTFGAAMILSRRVRRERVSPPAPQPRSTRAPRDVREQPAS